MSKRPRRNHTPAFKAKVALHVSRGSVYYLPRPVSATDLEVMRRLDRTVKEQGAC
jgi:putative transposase